MEMADPPSSVKGSLSSSELKNDEEMGRIRDEKRLAHHRWGNRWDGDTFQRSAWSEASSCGGGADLLGVPLDGGCWQSRQI